MQISVQSDIDKAIAKLTAAFSARQLPFAIAKALTTTAKDVQAEVKSNMPERFIIRRPWVIGGIMIKPANKQNLESTVYSRDAFMGLQEFGGPKDPRGHYIAVPTSMVKRTAKDMIRKADRPAALGDKVSIVEYNGEKFLALKKPRKAANGQRLRFLYLLIPRAKINERLKLREDGDKVIKAKFSQNLEQALELAMQSAKR